MPHTSRRKKNAPTKRLEVTGDDGWTRVTTTNLQRRGPKAIGSSAGLIPLHEKTTPEKGATVEKISREYEKIQEQWTASESCTALVSLVQGKVLPENVEIDRCLIFGSGSFCGLRQGWISRKHSAMCQLAVVKSIQKTIEEKSGRSITVYAQDPAYNDVDVEFLKSLGVDVAETPSGFDLVTEKSLVYTPGAEYHVEIGVLRRKPAVLLSSKLNWLWRNEKGLACTNRVSVQRNEGEMGVEQSTAPADSHRHEDELLQRDLEADCQMLEDFLRNKQETKLPTLDVKDNPFNDQHLYWLKPQEAGDDRQNEDVVKRVESLRRLKVGNLDFDARVPIPVSVFPSTYRNDATSVETTTETKVEGEANQGEPQRVGREDTRFRKEEETVDVRTHTQGKHRERRPAQSQSHDDFQVIDETRVTDSRYPSQFQERQYTDRQVSDRQTNRFAEVDLSRERYQAPSEYRSERQANVDVTTTRQQGDYDYHHKSDIVRDRPYETQIDITEREYRRKVHPNYDIEYERRRPVRDDVVIEKDTVREVKVDKEPRGKMGYYDDHGEYHSFRRGVERAADKVFHPFSHHHDRETVVVKESGPTRVADGRVESVRYVEPRGGVPGNTVTIPCHFIRIGDLVILQGRPCQIIRISQSGQTGQYRYLGVDLFTRQLHEESSFCSNPEPSVVVQSMLGPVFKQYRILDLREDGAIVCMTETGDVKQGLPVIDQGGLYNKIGRAFDDGRGSVRALVINDGGRELIVDYKVIHGSRL
ncbi:hypothetical protein PMZ80_006085 [Knufia obscura]|uniref:SRR1-like domain-containing protein n=1 Tax=Knufia obscura TaxID=1635080 RepID=A0ABR0RNF6_9EURO|nr:hypothetical protein PMZ80_006085 [Knufia obscura]